MACYFRSNVGERERGEFAWPGVVAVMVVYNYPLALKYNSQGDGRGWVSVRAGERQKDAELGQTYFLGVSSLDRTLMAMTPPFLVSSKKYKGRTIIPVGVALRESEKVGGRGLWGWRSRALLMKGPPLPLSLETVSQYY